MKQESHAPDRRRALESIARTRRTTYFVPAWNETVEAADTVTCVPSTPTVTEGPYWVDEKLFRSDIRTDPSTGTARAGIPLVLTITVEISAAAPARRGRGVRGHLALRRERNLLR